MEQRHAIIMPFKVHFKLIALRSNVRADFHQPRSAVRKEADVTDSAHFRNNSYLISFHFKPSLGDLTQNEYALGHVKGQTLNCPLSLTHKHRTIWTLRLSSGSWKKCKKIWSYRVKFKSVFAKQWAPLRRPASNIALYELKKFAENNHTKYTFYNNVHSDFLQLFGLVCQGERDFVLQTGNKLHANTSSFSNRL